MLFLIIEFEAVVRTDSDTRGDRKTYSTSLSSIKETRGSGHRTRQYTLKNSLAWRPAFFAAVPFGGRV